MAANWLLGFLPAKADQLECATESLAAGKWTRRELTPLIKWASSMRSRHQF